MHAQITDLPATFSAGEAAIRTGEWGDMSVTFYRVPAGGDWAALLKGAPGDRCQSPHWGYLLKGRLRVSYEDHDEVIAPGEVFQVSPGHIPHFEEATEMVEFSPTAEFNAARDVILRNFMALGAAPRTS